MSTERMDDNQDAAGTDGGTARMDAGTARMDDNNSGTVTAAGVVFVSGQEIDLNGKNCVIDSMIGGSSGEAIVYKVTIDGKPYALKLYKPNTPLSDTAKKVIAKIKNNPKDRVIKTYDFGKYNEQDFEIMEYAEGGTLDQFLKSNGAIHDITKIKNIVKMINEGLEQLHNEYKVIYQDLKPENIYFKDTNKTSLVLADFGISSLMEGYDKEVEVTASVTDLYAAPELARMGNEIKVIVTPAIDYYALGITMFELWLGEKPFKGLKGNSLRNKIRNEEIDFPMDMPSDYATIIQGLIRSKPKDRWGNEQVQKWLKGEALTLESKVSQKTSTAYDPLKFSNAESASSPKELAALMEKYPDIGKTCLYDGIIKEWCKKAGDLELYNKIQNITSQYKDKDAGLYSAILALDPERPFKSRGGKICKTGEDIADAIMAESAYYMDDLKKPNANLYLYIEATEGSREVADTFHTYFIKEYSPKRALTLVYLKLQGDEGITIGKKRYQSPDELKNEKDAGQIDLVKKAVKEKDSMLLVWLSVIYGNDLKSTDAFNNLSVLEQFFLLGLLPFLSFKDFNSNSLAALRALIDTCPGRSDLFKTYAAQGLPFTGQDYTDKMTPIYYVVFNFNALSQKHGANTIYNLIRLLHKFGADVNEYTGGGRLPIFSAYDASNINLINLLLELGTDETKYQAYKEKCEEQERQNQKAREEKEQREKQERENEEIERILEKVKSRRKIIIINLRGLLLTFVPLIVGLVLYYIADEKISVLITSFIFLGVPLIIIHLRGHDFDWSFFSVSSIVVFWIAILVYSFGYKYWFGAIAMIAAFIIAIKNPIQNYWESFYSSDKLEKEEKWKLKAHRKPINKKLILIPAIVVAAVVFIIVYMQTGSFFKFEKNDEGTLTVTGYSGRKQVVIPAVKKGVSVTRIGDKAFYNNEKITSVTIPDGVTSIGNSAFQSCSELTSVNIPDSVISIGDEAFSGSSLTSVTLPKTVSSEANYSVVDGIWYNKEKTKFIFPPKTLGITGKVTIPNGVTKIRGFAGLTELTGVTMPNTVTSIESRAFDGCTSLAGITIPNSVTIINPYAFTGCSSLTNITIPGSVTIIGSYAFTGCSSLTSVTFQSKNHGLKERSFSGDLYDKYSAGGIGTYTRSNGNSDTWTKKR